MNTHGFIRTRRRTQRDKGQATILALGALIFLTVMTLAVFNVQQASYSKQKVMNAADGAAYAAASTLARDMNYMAYTNRAMVANHVAVGQVVSLVSLTQNLGQLSKNAATVIRVIGLVPGLNLLQGLATALERVDNLIDRLPPLMQPFIMFEEAIIGALSVSQTAVRVMTVIDAKSNLDDVIKANDPHARWETNVGAALTTATSLEAFVGYSKSYSDTKSYNRFREVVNDSRDNFTRDRPWLGFFRGGSNMRENNKSWTGLDGAEINLFLTRIYLSWGGAETGTRTSSRGNQSYGGLARRTANRAFNARQYMNAGYSGVRPYFEMGNLGTNTPAESPAIVVAVSKPLNRANDPKSQLSDSALDTGQADGAFRLPTGRNNVVSAAASRVYFKRPNRNDEPVTDAQHLRNRHYTNGERPSLFSPYWQARLTEMPLAAVAALQAFD